MQIWDHEKLFEGLDPPWDAAPEEELRHEFPQQLELVSRLWFETGLRAGIAAHLNLALLCELSLTHDREFPRRFESLRSLRKSLLATDRLLRDVTDSGKRPTGGISAPKVQARLAFVSDRLRKSSVPPWMTTYGAWSLVECVERAATELGAEESRLHLGYMSKAFRLMGLRFTDRRDQIAEFGHHVEAAHTGRSPFVARHAKNLLLLAEMLGVSTEYHELAPLLPEAPRKLFREIYPEVRPEGWQRHLARASGRFATPDAGQPRRAVQSTAWRRPALPEPSAED